MIWFRSIIHDLLHKKTYTFTDKMDIYSDLWMIFYMQTFINSMLASYSQLTTALLDDNAKSALLLLMFLILNKLKWIMTFQTKTLKASWTKNTPMQYNQTQRARSFPPARASPQTGTSSRMVHGQSKAKVVEAMRAIDVQITKTLCGFLWKKNWWAVLAENKERISETATFKNMMQVMWA